MRKTFFLVLALMVLTVSGMLANDNSANLIRRAYIDVLGVPPTVVEIDWLLVYNKGKSYETAVDYLINNPKCKWNIPKSLAKMLLLSKDYKEQAPKPMLPEQVIKNLFYITGLDINLPYTEENIKMASYKLVNLALVCCDGETEIIDYLATSMMSRGTNLEEINYLTKLVRTSNKSEKDTWYDVLQEIMKFPDTFKK
jgi:hypothetical protein